MLQSRRAEHAEAAEHPAARGTDAAAPPCRAPPHAAITDGVTRSHADSGRRRALAGPRQAPRPRPSPPAGAASPTRRDVVPELIGGLGGAEGLDDVARRTDRGWPASQGPQARCRYTSKPRRGGCCKEAHRRAARAAGQPQPWPTGAEPTTPATPATQPGCSLAASLGAERAEGALPTPPPPRRHASGKVSSPDLNKHSGEQLAVDRGVLVARSAANVEGVVVFRGRVARRRSPRSEYITLGIAFARVRSTPR